MRFRLVLASIAVVAAGPAPAFAQTAETNATTEARTPDKVQQAMTLAREGKAEAAISLVDPIIADALADQAKDPDALCPSFATQLFAAMMQKSSPGLAIQVSVENDWCEAMLVKGFALTELKRHEEAASVLGTLVRHDKSNPNYFAEYGFALLSSGKLDQAEGAYQQAHRNASQLKDKAARAHWRGVASRGLGYIAFERQDWDKAEKAYKASLKDAPGNAIALSELKLIAERRGK